MARTTAIQVGGIIEVDEDDDLTPFIDTATMLTTDVCGSAGYSDTKLELIERYLAAHFYSVYRPRHASERAGPVARAFMHEVGLNLAVTLHGQQAMLLDTAGGLAVLNKQTETGGRRNIGVTWLGTPPSEATPAQ